MARDEINAFLGAGTSYEGKLSFQGSVRIDGNFHGEIESEGTLVVGKDAQLQGTFKVAQLVLSGTMQGTVLATQRIVLNKQAHFFGSLGTPVLVVEEGADLRGQVNYEENKPGSGNADEILGITGTDEHEEVTKNGDT